MKTSISQAGLVRASNDVCSFCHYPLSLIGCTVQSSVCCPGNADWRKGARPRNSAAAAALNPDPCFHLAVAGWHYVPHNCKAALASALFSRVEWQTCHCFHSWLFQSAPNPRISAPPPFHFKPAQTKFPNFFSFVYSLSNTCMSFLFEIPLHSWKDRLLFQLLINAFECISRKMSHQMHKYFWSIFGGDFEFEGGGSAE